MYGMKPFRVCVLIKDEKVKEHLERKIKLWFEDKGVDCITRNNNYTYTIISLDNISFDIHHFPDDIAIRGLKYDLFVCDNMYVFENQDETLVQMLYESGRNFLVYHKQYFRNHFKSIEKILNEYNIDCEKYNN